MASSSLCKQDYKIHGSSRKPTNVLDFCLDTENKVDTQTNLLLSCNFEISMNYNTIIKEGFPRSSSLEIVPFVPFDLYSGRY